jgi:hypothetical protein
MMPEIEQTSIIKLSFCPYRYHIIVQYVIIEKKKKKKKKKRRENKFIKIKKIIIIQFKLHFDSKIIRFTGVISL